MSETRLTQDTATLKQVAPQCPHIDGEAFDPLDPDQAADPHPWLRRAREETPVFYMPEYEMWCVTRYDDLVEVLKDTETYSNQNVIDFPKLHPDFKDAFPSGPTSLVSMDPPEHSRIRRLAQKAFTPKAVARQKDEVRELCNDLIDDFVTDGHCDFVSQYAQRLPVRAITQFVGAPLRRVDYFYQWAHDRIAMLAGAPELSDEERKELSERAVDFQEWLYDFVEDRRARPRDDLTSGLVHATTEEGDAALTTSEVIMLIASILSAGTSTTAHFLPLMVRELLRHPEQWEEVKADRGLIPQAVDECLRLVTSVHGVNRLTMSPSELGGVTIPEGETLYLHYASANRDATVFDNPERLDIHRDNANRHVAFGRYAHMCLGAPLARLESEVTLECIIDRMPDVRMSEGGSERWTPSLLTPGLQSLPLEWS